MLCTVQTLPHKIDKLTLVLDDPLRSVIEIKRIVSNAADNRFCVFLRVDLKLRSVKQRKIYAWLKLITVGFAGIFNFLFLLKNVDFF